MILFCKLTTSVTTMFECIFRIYYNETEAEVDRKWQSRSEPTNVSGILVPEAYNQIASSLSSYQKPSDKEGQELKRLYAVEQRSVYIYECTVYLCANKACTI